MKKNLLILGAGRYGAVVHDIALSSGLYENIDFLDDNVINGTIGKFDDIEKFIDSYSCAIVGIGNVDVREKWLHKLISLGYEVPVLSHSSAVVSPTARIGYGTIIEPNATVQANVSVGIGCLICSSSVLKHNAVVEDLCYIDCNSTVMPETVVPHKTRVNSNTVFFKRD